VYFISTSCPNLPTIFNSNLFAMFLIYHKFMSFALTRCNDSSPFLQNNRYPLDSFRPARQNTKPFQFRSLPLRL
jgi:hypothetical protein